jgi:hypothetical protein
MNSFDTDKISRIMKHFHKAEKSDMTMREMLKITRKLNEDVVIDTSDNDRINKATQNDEEREEGIINGLFQDINVNIEYYDLEVYDDFVFWGGVINNELEFTYTVPPVANSTGVEFKYSENFNKDNEENSEITSRLEANYDEFNKYWIENLGDTNNNQ